MSEKQLTKSQKNRIDEIIKLWEKDIKEQIDILPPSDGKTLDGPRTKAHTKLANKYMPMIQAIMEEN